MRWTGPFLAAMAVLYAALLGGQTYAPYGMEASLGIALGAGSVAAMSLALILSIRPRWIEPFFGGLDRMYSVHKWLGITALALMIGHNTVEPELEGFVRETRLGEFASDVGEIALNGFIGLILISWIKRIPFTRIELPWPIWRFTHRFTGLLFAVVAFHQVAIDTPIRPDHPFSLYMNTLSMAGVLAWLFTQFVAPRLRQRVFSLKSIDRHVAVTEINLRPEGRVMRWRPGQFAFVTVSDTGINEAHPFTISSAPGAHGNLRFSIKALGDWTRRLPARLAPGQRLKIDGPYGRFLFRPRVQRQVWLAGGIGITPFLAWAEALTDTDHQEISLIWAVTSRAEAFAVDRIQAIAARHPSLKLHVVVSSEQGRLTAEKLTSLVPFSLGDSELFYCGPSGLLQTILSGLDSIGHRPRKVHSEAFEFR